MSEIVIGGRTYPLIGADGAVSGYLMEERIMGGESDVRTTEVSLYSLAGQTIFHIYGANGAPSNCFESYPDVPIPYGQMFAREFAVRRTKEEFEAEQARLRKG